MSQTGKIDWKKELLIFLCSAVISSLYVLAYTALFRQGRIPAGWLIWNILRTTADGLFLWHILEKAGVPGWKGLIPYYNVYTLWQTFYGKGWLYLAACLFTLPQSLLTRDRLEALETKWGEAFLPVMLIFLVGLLTLLVMLIVHDYRCSKALAAAFGKSKSFAFWCLFLLMSVGWGILAYGPPDHVRPAVRSGASEKKK